PSNILLCERGGCHDIAKLLDFGLVRAQAVSPGGEKLTQEDTIAGTPAYMSPNRPGVRRAWTLPAISTAWAPGPISSLRVSRPLPAGRRSRCSPLTCMSRRHHYLRIGPTCP